MTKHYKESMMSINFVWMTVLLSATATSCTKDRSIEESLQKIIGKQMVVNDDSMLILQDSLYFREDVNKDVAEYKFIAFFDSTECSSCQMKKLFEWNDFMVFEKNRLVDFYFIFSTNEIASIERMYRNCNLKHSILVDTCNIFLSTNKYVPSEKMFHYFMLNKKDEIIFVGNITQSGNLEKIFRTIVYNEIQCSQSNINLK